MRDGSLVLLWAAPLYEGRSPVTGYLLEMSQGDQSDDWTALNEKLISDTHYKVSREKKQKGFQASVGGNKGRQSSVFNNK